jgi:chromosome segregation ATPase
MNDTELQKKYRAVHNFLATFSQLEELRDIYKDVDDAIKRKAQLEKDCEDLKHEIARCDELYTQKRHAVDDLDVEYERAQKVLLEKLESKRKSGLEDVEKTVGKTTQELEDRRVELIAELSDLDEKVQAARNEYNTLSGEVNKKVSDHKRISDELRKIKERI